MKAKKMAAPVILLLLVLILFIIHPLTAKAGLYYSTGQSPTVSFIIQKDQPLANSAAPFEDNEVFFGDPLSLPRGGSSEISPVLYRNYLSSGFYSIGFSDAQDFIINDSGVLTSYLGNGGTVEIPPNVIEIGASVFLNKSNVTKVVFNEGLKKINNTAFQGSGLAGELSFPQSLESIGDSAFRNCVGLRGDLIIPDSVISLGAYAFFGCSGLNGNLKLSENLTAIRDNTFSGLTQLTGTIVIPNNVTEIGVSAFYNLQKITGVVFGKELKKFVNSAIFNNCNSVEEVTFLSAAVPTYATTIINQFTGLKVVNVPQESYADYTVLVPYIRGAKLLSEGIGDFAIMDGVLLQYTGDGGKVEIPAGVTEIGAWAFFNKAGVTKVVFNDGLKKINSSAFQGSGLSGELIFPQSLESIADNAFKGCANLSVVRFNKNLSAIGAAAFSGCTGLTSIELNENLQSIGADAFNGCNKATGTLIIPGSVTGIADNAFRECASLTGLKLNEGLVGIGTTVFFNCKGFTGKLVIPDSVATINNQAFYGCLGFNALEIGSFVTSIGNEAFRGCAGFRGDLIIPDSVQTLGASAFYGCSGFDGRLILSDNLTVINNYTFQAASQFTGTLIIPDKVVEIGYGAFYNLQKITGVVFGKELRTVSANTVGASQVFGGCYSVEEVKFLSAAVPTGATTAISQFTGLKVVNVPQESYNDYSILAPYIHGAKLLSEGIGDFVITEEGVLIQYTGDGGKVEIPSGVIEIGASAFQNKDDVTRVVFNEGLKRINNAAFQGAGLTGELNFPESLESIGDNAFKGCAGISVVRFNKNLHSIGAAAFYGNTGLISIVLNEGLLSIGADAFFGCNKMTGTLTIPGSVTSIGGNAFKDCVFLTGLKLNEGLELIGAAAFYNCKGLTGQLSIPNSVTAINNQAFYGCLGFNALDIGSSVTSIGNEAFRNCAGFRGDLIIPDSVTVLGNYAFYSCDGFDGNLKLSQNLTSIKEYAFYGLSQLTGTLIIPDNVTDIGYGAFYNLLKIKSVVFGRGLKSLYTNTTNFNHVFGNCSSVEEVTFLSAAVPAGATAIIGQFAGLKVVNVPQESYNAYTVLAPYIRGAKLVSEDSGDFVISEEGVLIQYAGDGGVVEIPAGVIEIGASAFQNKSNITAVVFNEGLKKINNAAFQGAGLTGELGFPQSLESIGDNAFRGCAGLIEVRFNNNLTSIGAAAFNGNTGLVSIELNEGLKSIGADAFNGCNKLTGTLNIPGSLTNIGVNAFRDCISLTGLILNEGLEVIGATAFYNCKGFTGQLSLPDSVTTINNQAFYGCIGFNELKIGSSVTSIGNDAFVNCTGFKGDLIIPDSVTALGNYAFYGCNGFDGNLRLSENLMVINNYAFLGASQFTGTLIIPDKVTDIGIRAFGELKNITGVVFGKGFKKFTSGDVFGNCSGVAEVTFLCPAVPTNAITIIGQFAGLKVVNVPQESYNDYMVLTPNMRGAKLVSGGNGDFVITDGILLQYNGDGGRVEIPAEVVEIGAAAFINKSTVTQVVFNEGLKKINNTAFQSAGLKGELTFPQSLESIGDNAFKGCVGLNEVRFNNNLKSIGAGAFYGDTGLVFCEFNENLQSIGASAFYGAALTSIELNEGLLSIGADAFSGCAKLAGALKIPGSVTNIGDNAFKNCTALTSLELNEGLKTIGLAAFNNCKGFSGMLSLPDSVTTINNQAFYGCLGFNALKIGSSLTTIGNEVFRGCAGFRGDLIIPDSVISLGATAFYGCGFDGKLRLSENLTVINDSTFSSMTQLTGTVVIPAKVTAIGSGAFYNLQKITGVVFGNGLKTLSSTTSGASQVFGSCYSVEEVTFLCKTVPAGATTVISQFAGLKVVNVPQESYNAYTVLTPYIRGAKLISEGSDDFVIDDGVLIQYTGAGGKVEIPASVVEIGASVFQNKSNVTQIVFNEGLKKINNAAFQSAGLTGELSFPQSLESMGENAFRGCVGISGVSFGANLKSIGTAAFYGDTGLLRIEFNENLKSIGASAFYGATGLASIELKEGLLSIGADAFNGCTKMTGALKIPGSVTSVGDNAFKNCTALISLEFKEGDLTTIGAGAFYNCAKMAGNLWLPPSLSVIGNEAFRGCVSFSGDLVIPDSVIKLGAYAFYGCSGFNGELKLSENIIAINEFTFYGASQITGILVIPNRISDIGRGAFRNMSNLSGVVFGKDLRNISADTSSTVFGSCSAVKEVIFLSSTVPAGATTIIKQFTGLNTVYVPKDSLKAYTVLTPSIPNVTLMAEDSMEFLVREGVLIKYLGDGGVVEIPADIEEIAAAAFIYKQSVTKVVLPAGLKYIGDYAFAGSGLTGPLALNAGLISIGSYAFADCGGLSGNLVIPDSVISMGGYAFNNCVGLNGSLKISESLTSINACAFSNCVGLKGDLLTIPDKVTAIGEYAFAGISGIKTLILGTNLSVISAKNPFDGCNGVTEVMFKSVATPAGVTAIFAHMSNLKTIYIPAESIDAYKAALLPVVGPNITFSYNMIIMGLTNVRASKVYSKTVELTWDEHLNKSVTQYVVERDGVIVSKSAKTSYVDTNLETAKKYTYHIYGITDDGVTTIKAMIEVAPKAPSILSIRTDNATKIGVSNSKIYITALNSNNHQPLGNSKPTGTLYYMEGEKRILMGEATLDFSTILAPNVIYIYDWDISEIPNGEYTIIFRLTDIDGVYAEKEAKVTVNHDAPKQVAKVIAESNTDSITLSWAAAAEADVSQYRIYRKAEGAGSYGMLATMNSRSIIRYQDTAVLRDITYNYYVTAVNSFGQESLPSDTVSAAISLDTEKPLIQSISPQSDSYICQFADFTVSATDNVGVTGIFIYYSQDSGKNWTQFGQGYFSPYSVRFDTKIIESRNLKIKAVAYDAAGNESNPFITDYIVLNEQLDKIQGLNYTTTQTALVLSWERLTSIDMTFYRVEQRNSQGVFVGLKDVIGTTYANISGLKPDTEYTFRVAAYDKAGKAGVPSDIITIRTLPVPEFTEKVSGLSATQTQNGGVLRWDAIANAFFAYYIVEQKNPGGQDFSQIAQTTLNQVQVGKLNTNTNYVFRVRAIDSFGSKGQYSDELVFSTTYDAQPVVSSISPATGALLAGEARISVTASHAVALASIRLESSLDNGVTWDTVGELDVPANAAQYVANFTLNTKTMRDGSILVRAFAANKNDNVSSGYPVRQYYIDNTPPSKVENLRAEGITTKITLNWNDVADNDFNYFQVEQKNGAAFAAIAKVNNQLGYIAQNLDPEKEYTFRVAAVDKAGNIGPYSAEVSAYTVKDDYPPVITLIIPKPARFSSEINLSITAKDDHKVKNVTIETSGDLKDWQEIASLEPIPSASVTVNHKLDVKSMPEGFLYIRAIAQDFSGNFSVSDDTAPFVQYMIDHTPPAQPVDMSIESGVGYINVKWVQGDEVDLSSYNVYRSVKNDQSFTLLCSNYRAINYVDYNVGENTEYFYKISAVDKAGNVSEFSEIVSGVMKNDAVPPEIYSISPKSGSVLNKNSSIGVLAADNNVLAAIYADYKVEGSNEWKKLGELAVNSNSATASFNLNVLEIGEKAVEIRTRAVDACGNASEYKYATYMIKLTPPMTPMITVTPGPLLLTVSWTSGNEADLLGYKVYRKADNSSAYVYVAQRSAYNTSYIDMYTDVRRQYKYKVEAYNSAGNVSVSESDYFAPINDDAIPPEVIILAPDHELLGNPISFNGSHSTDNVGIDSYYWDFGDKSSSEKAVATHTYAAAGAYTVSLTVTDYAGNTSSSKQDITISGNAASFGFAKVQVQDDKGSAVAGANIYIGLGEPGMEVISTDASGFATFKRLAGQYTVGAYKNGYLPAKKELTIHEGITTEGYVLNIVESDIVVGELTWKRMTLAEIKAAGIDVYAPENQNMFKYEIQITYQGTPIVLTGFGGKKFALNENEQEEEGFSGSLGREDIKWENWEYKDEKGELRQVVPRVVQPKNTEKPVIFIMDMPGEATWLKEFYEVKLYISNQADPEFWLENCSVTLNFADGLSLMKGTTYGENDPWVDLGIIRGQESKEIYWILRADKDGQYDLSADFSGVLAQFNEPVYARFVTKEPIMVDLTQGLTLDIIVENEIIKDKDSAIQIGLTNEGANDVYLPKINMEKGEFEVSFKTVNKTGIMLANDDAAKETLKPGESIWWVYTLPLIYDNDGNLRDEGEFKGFVSPADMKFIDMKLVDMALKATGGNIEELPYRFTTVPALSINAVTLEVYEGAVADPDKKLEKLSFSPEAEETEIHIPEILIEGKRSGTYQPEVAAAGAEVFIMDYTNVWRMIKLDEDGRFVLPARDVTLKRTNNSYSIQLYSRRGNSKTVYVEVKDRPGTLTFSGVVKNAADGSPILNADIALISEGSRIAQATTDSSGQFSIEKLWPDTYTAQIKASGYYTVNDTFDLTENLYKEYLLDRTALFINPIKRIPIDNDQGDDDNAGDDDNDDDTDDDDDDDDPWLGYIPIDSYYKLDKIRDNLSGRYYLIKDIEVPAGANWKPIGTFDKPFTGILDGQGFKISNLAITYLSNPNQENEAGLFGFIYQAQIRNLGMENTLVSFNSRIRIKSPAFSSLTGLPSFVLPWIDIGTIMFLDKWLMDMTDQLERLLKDKVELYAGAICAKSYYSEISNCYNRGFIRATTGSSDPENCLSYTGGIAGLVVGGKINGCYNEAEVRAASGGTIEQGYGSEACSGGIAGVIIGAEVNKCYNQGTIYASAITCDDFLVAAFAGGIVGKTSGAKISNCYNQGHIQAYSTDIISPNINPNSLYATYSYQCCAGGIAGYSGGLVECSYNTGNVLSNRSTYMNARLGVIGAYAGGIVGKGDIVNNSVNISPSIVAMLDNNTANRALSDPIGAKPGEESMNLYVDDKATEGEDKVFGNNNPISLSETKKTSTYTGGYLGWDFDKTWLREITKNNGLPVFGEKLKVLIDGGGEFSPQEYILRGAGMDSGNLISIDVVTTNTWEALSEEDWIIIKSDVAGTSNFKVELKPNEGNFRQIWSQLENTNYAGITHTRYGTITVKETQFPYRKRVIPIAQRGIQKSPDTIVINDENGDEVYRRRFEGNWVTYKDVGESNANVPLRFDANMSQGEYIMRYPSSFPGFFIATRLLLSKPDFVFEFGMMTLDYDIVIPGVLAAFVTVNKNNESEARNGVIAVWSEFPFQPIAARDDLYSGTTYPILGDIWIEEIMVIQDSGGYLNVVPEYVGLSRSAQSKTVKVETNFDFWKAKSSASWLTISPESSNNSNTILTLGVSENTLDDERVADITVYAYSNKDPENPARTKKIHVVQSSIMVNTITAVNTSKNSALLQGSFSKNSKNQTLQCGFVFYKQGKEEIAQTIMAKDSTETASTFEAPISPLEPNTTYYYYAYVTDYSLMIKGPTKEFRTLD